MPITITPSERIGRCTRMRRFIVRFNKPESFVHTRSSAGFTIITSGFEVSVHTGCDPACSFEDLGNAVRKIWIDLKIKIDFKKLKISPRSVPPQQGPYCAVGTIHYPEDGAKTGLLLYIKPGFQGTEPVSVGSYAATSTTFPHESTGEQLFGESQFEAYRALGEYIVSSIDGGKSGPYPDIGNFISAVSRRLDGGSPLNFTDEFW
jgi:hypothetical protein